MDLLHKEVKGKAEAKIPMPCPFWLGLQEARKSQDAREQEGDSGHAGSV